MLITCHWIFSARLSLDLLGSLEIPSLHQQHSPSCTLGTSNIAPTTLSTIEASSLPVYRVSRQATTRTTRDEPNVVDQLGWAHLGFLVRFSSFDLVSLYTGLHC